MARKQQGTEPPLTSAQVRKLPAQLAKSPAPEGNATPVHAALLEFPAAVDPGLETRFQRVASSGTGTLWRLEVSVTGAPAHSGRLAPRIEHRVVRRSAAESARGPLKIEPARPDFVGSTPVPKRGRLPRRRKLRRRNGKRLEPLYVFPPDGRYTYFDLSYPWMSVGQVNSNGSISSGVLVGPRHVLAASHALDWNAPWAVFRAHHHGSYDRAVGHTWCVWYYEKLDSVNSETLDEDYVVCVLDQPIGHELGWFGARTYHDDWDDEPYWAHCGYASDLGTAEFPTFQDEIRLEEEDGGNMKAMSSVTADLTEAHSGGPVFGWWPEGPYVVGVVSGQGQGKNWISGGTSMVRLIQDAVAQTP